MTINVPTKPLLEAMQAVAVVAPARTAKDILKSIHLTASDQLTLLASDGEVSLRRIVRDADISAPGATLLSPQRLIAILGETADDCVRLSLNGGKLTCTTSRSRFELQAADPAEFPAFPDFEGNTTTIAADSLRRAIAATVFAVDDTSTRYSLGGVCFETGYLAASDSRRMGIASLAIDVGNGRYIVPARAARMMSKFSTGDVSLGFTGSAVSADCGDSLLRARLQEGRFPDWKSIVPQQFRLRIELVAGPLLSAVRQSMIVANEESCGAEFVFTSETLTLKTTGQDVGNSDVSLPISADLPGEFTVSLEPRFVADWLKTLDAADTLTLGLNGPGDATLWECRGNRYVVMPLAG